MPDLRPDEEGHSVYEPDPTVPLGLGRRFPGLCHCARNEAHFTEPGNSAFVIPGTAAEGG